MICSAVSGARVHRSCKQVIIKVYDINDYLNIEQSGQGAQVSARSWELGSLLTAVR
jgi:hypothetical protein